MKSLEAEVFPPPLCRSQLQVANQIIFPLITRLPWAVVFYSCLLNPDFVCEVSVFAESQPSDIAEPASQSVPMVSTSTAAMTGPGEAVPGDDADDVFMAEAESDGWGVMTFI